MAHFPKRTITCGDLRAANDGQTVTLNGWIDVVRDHGGVLFFDVRDRFGLTQVVLDPAESAPDLVDSARVLRNEWVVAITGRVRRRPPASVNAARPTGEVEVVATSLQILNPCKTPPFLPTDEGGVNEELRLRYRYLDLRRPALRDGLERRHKFFLEIRRALDREKYIEVETPMLTRMTPEGSREYVVPSRVHPGKFYALPQSPQVFKQLIMVGGMDRYFQIARCMRDEDLRADRQPEFTQLDLELSFGDEEDVFSIIERVFTETIQTVFGRTVATPFPRLEYKDAMARFGVDKPDLRFGLEIQELSEIWRGAGFRVVDDVLAAGGVVRGLRIEGGATKLTRKEIDACTPFVQAYGAKGVAFLKQEGGQLVGPLAKFTDAARAERLKAACGFGDGDLLLIVADKERTVCKSLGELRNDFARKLDLLPKDGRLAFAWIVDFPMFDWSDEERKFVAAHHPFTTPLETYPGQMEKDPGNVTARAYDLVLNGWELGSGSVRIHERDMQARVFDFIGISPEDAKEKFGFFLEAFEFGAPPHCGIGIGLERVLALVLDRPNIRDLIAFPKTASASDLMNGSPSDVPAKNLAELHLRVQLPAPPPSPNDR